MIIPVRCFTCNSLIGSKYSRYLEIKENVKKNSDEKQSIEDTESISNTKAFEELKIQRYCCKRHLLAHIDLVNNI